MAVQLSLVTLFLQGAALGFTAAAAPGPFQAFLISESLVGGWQRGAAVAFAPLVSDLPIILFALLLLDQLPPFFLRAVSLIGGLFVLYLAWGLWGQWRSGLDWAHASEVKAGDGLRRGVMINILGPGPYLFWTLVLGPILLSALRKSLLHGGAFVLGFYGVFVGVMLGLVSLFQQARRLGSRAVSRLLLVSILVLVMFAGMLLRQGMIG